MFRFESLNIYQESIEYVNNVYDVVDRYFPLREKYILSSQIKRAMMSISLNIAEGSSRTNKDFNRFLGMAMGSIFEVTACFNIALKRQYITCGKYKIIYEELERLAKRINSFRKTLR